MEKGTQDTMEQGRQQAEQVFFDELYEKGWERENDRIDESVIPPNMRIYWDLVRARMQPLLEKNPNAEVLDCGCGYGGLTILLARLGARVTAVDISPKSIEIVQRVARNNEVADRIQAQTAELENLVFKDDVFDSVLGTRILHHVDISTSGRQLARVLKPGGFAIFWECTEANRFLTFCRKNLRKILPLPKHGTDQEHPLTREEIDQLGRFFGAPARIVPAPFYFFNLADEYLLRGRIKLFSRLLQGLDAAIAKYLPFLNRFSFHQILVFEKPDKG